MMTVDNLLLKIVNFNEPTIEEMLTSRDSRVLRSLATSAASNFFITENQGRLVIKILKENLKKLSVFNEEITTALQDPYWSKEFRHIEQIKRFYIKKTEEQELILYVELTYNQEVRKTLQGLAKQLENLTSSTNHKSWTADLTEKNIVKLYEALEPHGFDIDETIKNHYTTIKSWSEQTVRDQFLLTNIEHQNFQKAITADLGIETSIDRNIINDRSIRYQYFTETAKNPGESLTEIIANRNKPRVWIDKNEHSVADVIKSLIELRRLPLMIIFDDGLGSNYLENLKILSDALEKTHLDSRVGIYFRLANDETGKQFNQLIKEKQYNYELAADTQVVAVMGGKIPKFFLSNPWRPMSIITLNTKMGMRHGKTSVYSNCCDLIIEWADQPDIRDGLTIKS